MFRLPWSIIEALRENSSAPKHARLLLSELGLFLAHLAFDHLGVDSVAVPVDERWQRRDLQHLGLDELFATGLEARLGAAQRDRVGSSIESLDLAPRVEELPTDQSGPLVPLQSSRA